MGRSRVGCNSEPHGLLNGLLCGVSPYRRLEALNYDCAAYQKSPSGTGAYKSMDPQVRMTEPPRLGAPPNPIAPPAGCRFRTRCAQAHAVCAQVMPHLPISLHGVRHEGCSYRAGYQRAFDLLNLVKVPSAQRRLAAYPHELSGGLRQRAMIAPAMSCRPRLLLADEPTTALDARVQRPVLILLRHLQAALGMGVMFVAHDLGVAAEIADTMAVMYAGRIVETGRVEAVL